MPQWGSTSQIPGRSLRWWQALQAEILDCTGTWPWLLKRSPSPQYCRWPEALAFHTTWLEGNEGVVERYNKHVVRRRKAPVAESILITFFVCRGTRSQSASCTNFQSRQWCAVNISLGCHLHNSKQSSLERAHVEITPGADLTRNWMAARLLSFRFSWYY